jgi:HPt (histidine-containing phosphotransfer) domain-containing protein
MPTETLKWNDALEQVGGDHEFLFEVLDDLMNEACGAEREIADAIVSKTFAVVKTSAHKIKGSASYLCCETLQEISLNLQVHALANISYLTPADNYDYDIGCWSRRRNWEE